MSRLTTFERQGLVFAVRDSGPQDGVPVVLLHGFPQTSASWVEVAELLNDQGFRTLTPDQRGYTPGALPTRRRDYRLTELVADAVALIDAAGVGPVHVVGHDWGAAVAWGVAAERPDLVKTLSAVSVPHPLAFIQSMARSGQALKSWYMLFFQLPWLPELLLGNKSRFIANLRGTGQSKANAARDFADLQRLGSARTALNWYRGMPLTPPAILRRKVPVPTLQVWSDGDTAVGRKGHELSKRLVTGPWELQTLEGISHWIPDEAPQRLTKLLTEHFGKHTA